MKKALVLVAVILLIAVPVFANKGQIKVGLEAGYPSAGATASYGITDEIDAYVVAGYNYSNGIELSFGGEYNVYNFKIQDEKFDVLAGIQLDPRFNLSAKKGTSKFNMGAYATAGLAYDFSVKAEKANMDFTAYLRAGAGVDVYKKSKIKADFSFLGALGLVYHI